MLVAALGVTLVGFVLLVIALVMSSVAFAWACIVVCLIGFGLLIADMLSVRKGSKGSVEEPSTATAAPVAAAAEEPVEDLPGDGAPALHSDVDADDAPATEVITHEAPDEDVTDVAPPAADAQADVESVEDAVVRESEKDR